jgi:DNA-directed RNA polymerase subunit RPC12/RpoP
MATTKFPCVRCNSINLNLHDDGTYECIACGKKFRNHDERSRYLDVQDLFKIFEKYRLGERAMFCLREPSRILELQDRLREFLF